MAWAKYERLVDPTRSFSRKRGPVEARSGFVKDKRSRSFPRSIERGPIGGCLPFSALAAILLL
jgi:hypothetical protein